MAFALVVTHPFGEHAKGRFVEDPSEVAALLQSHPGHVVKVFRPDPEPEPEPPPTPTVEAPPAPARKKR